MLTTPLDGLPAPVQRYFRPLIKDGQPLIATGTLQLTGKINMSATGENGKSFIHRNSAGEYPP